MMDLAWISELPWAEIASGACVPDLEYEARAPSYTYY